MKKLILVLWCAVIFAACKKNSSSHHTIFLSKIILNGEVEEEYIYNSAGQLTEEKSYSNGIVNYNYRYSYDANGNPKEMIYYKMPENKASGKYVYTVDGQGRTTRWAIYSMGGGGSWEFSTYIDLDYDGKGQLAKESWKDEDEELSTYSTFGYYPNGNMRFNEVYYNYGPAPTKEWGSSYGPSDTALVAALGQVKALPVNFYLPYLVSPYINHYTYDNGDVSEEYHEVMSARQFNEWGLVTQQTITTKYIKPVKADEVVMMQYEYVEQ